MGRRLRKKPLYSSTHNILLVGEGDFSFALSLAKKLGSASKITATSLDSRAELKSKYRQANANVQELKGLGCTVIHEVNVHSMDRHPRLSDQEFDRIVFNFPHAGFHKKFSFETDSRIIARHQKVVKGFLKSAKGMVKSRGEVHVTHKRGHPYHKWDIETLAEQEGLNLVKAVPFCKDDYPGYNNKKGSGVNCDSAFPIGEASTFRFRIVVPLPNVSEQIRCKPCQAICNTIEVYREHILGKKHMRTVALETIGSSVYRCRLCNITCTSNVSFNEHLSGRKHIAQIDLAKQAAAGSYLPILGEATESRTNAYDHRADSLCSKLGGLIESGSDATDAIVCLMCNVSCNSHITFEDHLAGRKHKAAERRQNFEQMGILTKSGLDAREIMVCLMCNVSCNSRISFEYHLAGRKHKAAERGENFEQMGILTKSRSDARNTIVCPMCNVSCNSHMSFEYHLAGHKHKAAERRENFEQMGILTKSGPDARDTMVCLMCDVSCNSHITFENHPAERKHKAAERRRNFRHMVVLTMIIIIIFFVLPT